MRPMRGLFCGLLGCAALLAGCSSIMGPSEPPPPPPAPEPPPDIRQLLKSESSVLFDPTTQARNIVIGEPRRFDTVAGPQDGVCLRAQVMNRQGKPLGTVVYVVIVARGRIVDRRRALPADHCERDQYRPL